MDRTLQREMLDVARRRGQYWDDKPMHQCIGDICEEWYELSVACDSVALGEQCPKPIPLTNAQEELADIVIVCMSVAEILGFDLMEAIKIKHEYNKGRK